MAQVFPTVEDNTAPAIEITLKRGRNGTVVLTGASALLIIQDPKTKTITNTGHQNCIITDDLNGVITYEYVAGDFDNPKLTYTSEVRVTYPSGKVETFYEQLFIDPRPKLK